MDIRERLARYCVAAAQPYCENFKYKPIIGSNFLGINSACANARGVFVFLRFFDWHYLGLIRQFFAARRRKRHFTVLETLQIPIFIIAKTKKSPREIYGKI